ncbi:hypothetical protein [Streptomyces luteogriseus]|uniref:hypothetical protein n=1 Tax=Streptomyces luteogriseus TaxID=68233 RepID=UPI002E37431C|nr:hypothetical protein [Streptomyces luteogriseus]WTJ32223.1 hypothetical protein OID52_36765 [Streptomyces luteogriseus]
MGKRALKSRKVRLIAVVSALATGAAVITLLPSANAAQAEKTPDEIMRMCQKAKVINGEEQKTGSGVQDIFLADSCEFVETKFETFDGPKKKASIDFPNCEPNATEPAKVSITWKAAVLQGEGKYTATQQGAGGGLFGALSGAWLKHKATTDLTLKSVAVGDTETRDVPVGKVLHMEFTPKMQRMTGEWRVKINAKPGSTAINPVEEQNYAAPEVVEGAVVLGGAAGAPGIADGTSKPVLTDC